MIGAALTLLEWAAAGLAAIALVSAVQVGTYEPALVGLAAAGIAALARLISIRRASGVYSDAALRPLVGRRLGRSVNDNGGAW
ncbi:hypothetical protein [Methylobacterium radiotolerans]|uniref:hypothetical protein n=1 Tax=Methylobacterium radiotolerans TaxID=31998 RepID=UPI001F1730CD|nr:hypothetical protein [Methylobacterium radiotolerans]UIY44115.1 hypothetical protein LZ599_10690 [Methylobacterium radiotolerans]